MSPLARVVDSLERTVSSALLALVVGVLAGRLLAGTLQASGLHWSWAAVLLAAVVPILPSLDEVGPIALVACLSACRRGRRESREALESGGELAEHERLRITPPAALASLARRLARRYVAGDAPAGGSGERIPLGAAEDGEEVSVPLGARHPPLHALIVGATGSGKTVTQALLIGGAIRRGTAAVVLDPKGDPSLRGALAAAAEGAGRAFLEWTPAGPLAYNPFARGGDTEIADRVLAGERFTEPHYLRQAQRYLGHAVRALRTADGEVTLAGLADALDPGHLESLLAGLPNGGREQTRAYLDSLTQRQRADLAGVRDRVSILCESDVGPWLDTAGGVAGLELGEAIRAGAVVYFALQSDRRPLLAQMLGAAIVLDLQALTSALQGGPLPAVLAIDEFSALAASQVVSLFGRARSAGFSLLLSTQELADLRPAGHEQMVDQVLGNISLLIAHRQVLPASAELLAKLAGSREVWRVARHGATRTTRTRAHEPVLRGDRLAALEVGQAAVFTFGTERRARIVRVRVGSGRRWGP